MSVHGHTAALPMTTRWVPPLRAGLFLAFLMVDVYAIARWGSMLVWWSDAASYHPINLADLYRGTTSSLSGDGVFRYAPVLGQLLAPLNLLPGSAFLALWLAIELALVGWLGGRYWWLVLALPPVLLELELGNIHLLMAAAIALAVRWPAAWSFLVLTKVTPGIGMLWYAVRGEWRNFAIAIGATALIVLVGVALWPELWGQWFQSLIGMSQLPNTSLFGPLALRLPVALGILAVAARTDRRWLLPIVVILAMPSIWWHSLAILAAVPYLWTPAEDRRRVMKPNRRSVTGLVTPLVSSTVRSERRRKDRESQPPEC